MPALYVYCLYAIASFALIGWLVSFATRHYSHVDSMWSLFMLLTVYTTWIFQPALDVRGLIIVLLATVWGIRLSAFITWRNWGKEDYRYETIKQNNEPHFWFKSVYIVFGFQALLAWLISYPLYYAISHPAPWQALDVLALGLCLTGLYWEIVADWQMARFKRLSEHAGRVLDQGLWRYSRHPNYFGESLVWWAFALFALSAGSVWGLCSALVMHLLLLKVSGVALMEKTIVSRRPEYADYIAKTNAFVPGPPKHLPVGHAPETSSGKE